MSDHEDEEKTLHQGTAPGVDDFHKEFPSVPINEKVVRVVQCSISRKKLLRMGRMYLTAVHLCFSGIMTTPICVEWEQVKDIQKKSSMLFDSVNVFFRDSSLQPLCLTGFINGSDEAYQTMKMLWSVRKRYAGGGTSATSGASASAAPLHPSPQSAPQAPLTQEERSIVSPPASSGPKKADELLDPFFDDDKEQTAAVASDEPLVEKTKSATPRIASPEPSASSTPNVSGRLMTQDITDTPSPLDPPVNDRTPSRPSTPQARAATPPPVIHSDPLPPTGGEDQPTKRTPEHAATQPPSGAEGIHRTFPEVPKSESVLESFQCSYVSGVHRLGKMYVTRNYLLFWSVMMQTPITVKLRDVDSVDKSTSLKILEGLTVTTRSGERYEWTSFVSREKAYQMILELVTQQQRIDVAMGDGPVAEEKPTIEDLPPAATPAATPAAVPAKPQKIPSKDENISRHSLPFVTPTSDPKTAPVKIANLQEFDKYVTDWGSAISDPKLHLDGKELIAEVKFRPGYTLFDIFRYLIDDDTPMALEYRRYRKDTKVVYEPWRPCKSGPGGNAGQRKLVCMTIIRALRETTCEFTEYQRYAFVELQGQPHLVMQFSGQAIGVMFSDTFRAETMYVYSQAADPTTGLPVVTVKTYMYVQFLRFSIAKSKIKSSSISEITECAKKYHELSAEFLQRACPDPASPACGVGTGTSIVSDVVDADDMGSVPGTPARPKTAPDFSPGSTPRGSGPLPIPLPPTVIVQGGEANVAVAGVHTTFVLAWLMRVVLGLAGVSFIFGAVRLMGFSPQNWMIVNRERFGPDSNAQLAEILMSMVVESVWPLIQGITLLLLFVVLYLFHMVNART